MLKNVGGFRLLFNQVIGKFIVCLFAFIVSSSVYSFDHTKLNLRVCVWLEAAPITPLSFKFEHMGNQHMKQIGKFENNELEVSRAGLTCTDKVVMLEEEYKDGEGPFKRSYYTIGYNIPGEPMSGTAKLYFTHKHMRVKQEESPGIYVCPGKAKCNFKAIELHDNKKINTYTVLFELDHAGVNTCSTFSKLSSIDNSDVGEELEYEEL